MEEEMKVGKEEEIEAHNIYYIEAHNIHYTIGWMESAIRASIKSIEQENYELALWTLKRAWKQYEAYYKMQYRKGIK